MRPFFREELERLIEERGHGYTVTGDDINQIIPIVMRRSEFVLQQVYPNTRM